MSCDSNAPQDASARSDSTRVVKVNRRKMKSHKTRLYCILLFLRASYSQGFATARSRGNNNIKTCMRIYTECPRGHRTSDLSFNVDLHVYALRRVQRWRVSTYAYSFVPHLLRVSQHITAQSVYTRICVLSRSTVTSGTLRICSN